MVLRPQALFIARQPAPIEGDGLGAPIRIRQQDAQGDRARCHVRMIRGKELFSQDEGAAEQALGFGGVVQRMAHDGELVQRVGQLRAARIVFPDGGRPAQDRLRPLPIALEAAQTNPQELKHLGDRRIFRSQGVLAQGQSAPQKRLRLLPALLQLMVAEVEQALRHLQALGTQLAPPHGEGLFEEGLRLRGEEHAWTSETISGLQHAVRGNKLIGVVAQRDRNSEDPGLDDLMRVGMALAVGLPAQAQLFKDDEARKAILEGCDEQVHVKYRNRYGRTRSYYADFEGVMAFLQRRIEQALADMDRLGIRATDLKRMWLHQANLGMNQLIIKKLVGGEAGSDRSTSCRFRIFSCRP